MAAKAARFKSNPSPDLEERWRDVSKNWSSDAWCGSERGCDRRDDAKVVEPTTKRLPPRLFAPPQRTTMNDEPREMRELRSLGIGSVSASARNTSAAKSKGELSWVYTPWPNAPAAAPAPSPAAASTRSRGWDVARQSKSELSWVSGPWASQGMADSAREAIMARQATKDFKPARRAGTVSMDYLMEPNSPQRREQRAQSLIGPCAGWAW